jgi:glycosyltransferase involved in cell wall biosynthesis
VRLLYAFPEPLPLPRARSLQVLQSLAALAARGVDITLAHAPVPGSPCPFTASGLARPAGVKLLPLSRRLPGPLAALPPDSGRLFLLRLLQHLRRQDYDIVYVRHLKLAAALLRDRPGLPLVYEAHEVFGRTAAPRKAAIQRALEAAVLRGARTVICNSGGTAAALAGDYTPHCTLTVVPNGVDWPEHLPEKHWPQAGRQVIYSGSLFPWKGAEVLTAAAAALPGCHIHLYGGSPERVTALRAAAPASGALLTFHGTVPRARVLDALGAACIAVLPNRPLTDSDFTSPLKLFEYMAHGCAIVASDLPALREILGADDAVWVRPDDPAALAAGIAALAADPQRARHMGDRLRDKARGYTWEARAATIHALLQSLPQPPPS